LIELLPIAPLMIEHRIIERMIHVVNIELEIIQNSNRLNSIFIDDTVDFIRTYADLTHHGKEEGILFKGLKEKQLDSKHRILLNELIEEHVLGRKTIGDLVKAQEQYLQNNDEAIGTVITKLSDLIDFYPKHIEKEDKRFFVPIMKYFSKVEQDRMLEEGHIYDRKMIHRKYDSYVLSLEERYGIQKIKRPENWLDYL